MERKTYEAPSVVFKIGGGGNVVIIGSGQAPLDPTTASYSNWRHAVDLAGMDIDKSYEGYLKWMTENGYGAYVQREDER